MKKFISATITLIILITSNFALSYFFSKPFVELSFLTGLIFATSIWFFSTEGGVTTTMADAPFKRFLERESRTNTTLPEFEINIPFIISIVYTVISAIISIFIYWSYF